MLLFTVLIASFDVEGGEHTGYASPHLRTIAPLYKSQIVIVDPRAISYN